MEAQHNSRWPLVLVARHSAGLIVHACVRAGGGAVGPPEAGAMAPIGQGEMGSSPRFRVLLGTKARPLSRPVCHRCRCKTRNMERCYRRHVVLITPSDSRPSSRRSLQRLTRTMLWRWRLGWRLLRMRSRRSPSPTGCHPSPTIRVAPRPGSQRRVARSSPSRLRSPNRLRGPKCRRSGATTWA